jgi:cell pole-organizing protein PopZ
MIADDSAKAPLLKAPQPAPTPTPQIAYSKDAAAPHGDASGLSQGPDANTPTVVWRRPHAVEAETAADAGEPSADPLLSPEANEAVALSFGALSANLEVRSAELADSMVRDMLRPMVKEWLDDNLPAMVERLVRDEIQRIARGRK